MTHRHAFRRGVAPRMSDRDVRQWRRLITRASKLRADSDQRTRLAFVTAAEKAAKCIMPAGHQNAASPFSRLIRLGEEWMKSRPDTERRDDLALVAQLAAGCAEALDQAAQTQTRKDIDG